MWIQQARLCRVQVFLERNQPKVFQSKLATAPQIRKTRATVGWLAGWLPIASNETEEEEEEEKNPSNFRSSELLLSKSYSTRLNRLLYRRRLEFVPEWIELEARKAGKASETASSSSMHPLCSFLAKRRRQQQQQLASGGPPQRVAVYCAAIQPIAVVHYK